MSIEARHITRSYGSFKALDDVSIRINDGELVALLGPSGSGKTTLLRVIAGLDQPDPDCGGQIFFNDENVENLPARKRQVGFVFQHYALFRHMTVFDNIAFGLRVKPKGQRPPESQIRAKVRELLALIQLENLENRYPSQLSGGQRQRVALARALAIEPKVLLLDEPFGALDARVRQDLRRWLRRLHDELHITSVFVTHDQEEAMEVADRIVVMNAGRIEQDGPPDEVFHHPANEFVVNFLGNVNLFRGRVESGVAVFGPWTLTQSGVSLVDGQEARLFVRPHELDVRATPDGRPALSAVIQRVQTAGPLAKLEVLTADGQTIFAEMPHDRFRELNVRQGDTVFVSLKDARVFVEDYVI
ncbi:MAG TPA: sulfate ABC transporter ATP-binding protein [Candidatus Hydrogenedentes bacterium]|nr:sulfate ABC transporter ATP-binding protein [Candidatus Hydrogenedentota bacterium]HOJ69650.1 sulfate ABC transporter ATP-binding protein [Candidatus Hydrogenedentota bacterium]HOK89978.1 sulfate ABC transporter ATP-binding protein [Candidatus Hydrogenedentota bacterium]